MTPRPKQKTISKSVSVEGIGLQTGGRVKLTLKSSLPNSGITFIRTDLADRPALNLRSIDLNNPGPAERRTTLGFGPIQIQTTEHLLAALSGFSIDNIIIELDNTELPGLDGSAKSFADLIKSAGPREQEEPRGHLKIDKVVWCAAGDSLIAVFPDEQFKVSYTLSYNKPGLGTQFYSVAVNEASFEKEIAPARTFCLEEESLELLKKGLGKGANYDNTLVLGNTGPVKTALRFADEPVRHKILDLIGDLYILGMPVIGHVVAIKSGHSLNMELVKRLKERK
ncbi:MAG: UDP-3-O-acyl-N-acetylglucosamine deacetylase [Candidatus Omnitrophota bacterium]